MENKRTWILDLARSVSNDDPDNLLTQSCQRPIEQRLKSFHIAITYQKQPSQTSTESSSSEQPTTIDAIIGDAPSQAWKDGVDVVFGFAQYGCPAGVNPTTKENQ